MALSTSFPSGLVKRISKHDLHNDTDVYLDIWIYFNLIANTFFLPLLAFSPYYYSMETNTKSKKPPKLSMYTAFDLDPNPKSVSRAKLILMLGAPYVAECIFSLSALILAVSDPDKVGRKHEFFYCTVPNIALAQITATFTGLVCVGIVVVEARAYRSLVGLHRAGLSGHLRSPFMLRIIFFGIYIIFGIIVNVINVTKEDCLLPDLYIATGGTVIFLVFGSQTDVLRAWLFWLPSHPSQKVVSQSAPPRSWSLINEGVPQKPPNALVHNSYYLP
ncbi:hypothetical protein BD779DRAFT_732630 [Infundibulicybe gibba]|nr:hypothetical protein BD779DRAFT_732630 [Infundibulicybe gibba]